MKGKVINIVGDQAELLLFCDEEPANKGSHCGACQMMQQPTSKVTDTLMAKNTIGAKVGEVVHLELQDYAELKSTLILLVFPLVVFIVALGITNNGLELPIWESAWISLAAIAMTYVIIKRFTKHKTYFYLVEEKTYG